VAEVWGTQPGEIPGVQVGEVRLVGCSIHPKKETEVRGETCEKWVRMFEREIELTST